MMALQPTKGIFDAHVSFQQSTDFKDAEVDVSDAVVDFFQPDIFADTNDMIQVVEVTPHDY
jgi:hypothetical protein